jgi:hypothetical protein
MEPSNTDSEIVEFCQSWEQLCEPGPYIDGGSTFDAFLETVLCGVPRELVSSELELVSLQECRRILKGLSKVQGKGEAEDEDEDEFVSLTRRFTRIFRINLCGRAFFKTQEGYFGVCPESANGEDQVAIVLGCFWPLVLRPVIILGIPSYRVVGECYIPGVMHGEALLGPLPLDWSISYEIREGSLWSKFKRGDNITREDPWTPLPTRWRYWYETQTTFQKMKRKLPKHMRGLWFQNVEYKEITWEDPRVTPEALRTRGVNVREFVLV